MGRITHDAAFYAWARAMSDLGTLIAAATVSVSTAGGGIAWIWNKIERRFDAIHAEHTQAISKIEEEAARCEEREVRSQGREMRSQVRHGIMTVVVELLQSALARVDPHAWELTRTKDLMGEYTAIGKDEVLS